jgi:hypothetical protein
MTVTLQDVKAILTLSLGGHAVTGRVDNENWREAVYRFCGLMPDAEATK